MTRVGILALAILLWAVPAAASVPLDNRDSLAITTHDRYYGDMHQHVHPDVVYRPNWNGYNYWMAVTPYPGGEDKYENPSILASQDGINWVEPDSISNPIVPPIDSSCGTCHNNDPDLLFVGNDLVLYYNATENCGAPACSTWIARRTSSNGRTWSPPDTVLRLQNYPLSPAVVLDNGIYSMWYVVWDSWCQSSAPRLVRRTSADGRIWSAETTVTSTNFSGVPWHLDVQKDGSRFVMLYSAFPLPGGQSLDCGTNTLYRAVSSDGLAWYGDPTPVIRPSSPGSWDYPVIYRSSFLVTNDHLRVWYSGRNDLLQWHVSYTESPINDLTLIDCGLSKMRISWTAPYGRPISYYEIRYSRTPIDDSNWNSASIASGAPAPTAGGTTQTFWVNFLSPCTWYYFGVKWREADGYLSQASNSPTGRTKCVSTGPCLIDLGEPNPSAALLDVATAPALAIDRVTPNPATAEIQVSYSLPSEVEGGTVDLGVFDLVGRRVSTVVHGPGKAGAASIGWNLRDGSGQRVRNGMYWLRLSIGGQERHRGIIVQ